jgi:hypothetical protein
MAPTPAQQAATKAWMRAHPGAYAAWRQKRIDAGTWEPRLRPKPAPKPRRPRLPQDLFKPLKPTMGGKGRCRFRVDLRATRSFQSDPAGLDTMAEIVTWIGAPANMAGDEGPSLFRFVVSGPVAYFWFSEEIVAVRFKMLFGGV